MNTLVKEPISPNVSNIIQFDDIEPTEWFKSNDEIVHLYDNGIFKIDFPEATAELKTLVINEVNQMFDAYKELDALYPVTITGAKIGAVSDNDVGSVRFCNNDQKLASALTNLIRRNSFLNSPMIEGEQFEMVNVSQYFRFMKYSSGGEHYPHYDSDFEISNVDGDALTTMYSLVMYFTDCTKANGGEIAFLNDTTHHSEDKSDWTRQATDEESYLKILPKCMSVVLFPHTLCHTVLPFKGNERIIARGDVIFRRAA